MIIDDQRANYLQNLPLGQIGGQAVQSPFNTPQHVLIPMSSDNWKKLTRATQIQMLDELGILNGEQK